MGEEEVMMAGEEGVMMAGEEEEVEEEREAVVGLSGKCC